MQARYGFGPLMTPAVDLICRLITLQVQMELPIGLVLKASGAQPPPTHLLDPHRAMCQMRCAKYTLPRRCCRSGGSASGCSRRGLPSY
jgi:hypothetical protein